MTVVSLRGLHTALGEPVVTSGVVMVEYWAGSRPVARVDGADVIFPALITAPVVAGDPGVLDLPPTRGVCCVKWTVQSESSATSVVRFTEIPETAADFGDLVQVDPATFVPTGEVVAAWEAVVGTVEGLRDAAATSADEASASAQAAHDSAAPVLAAAATISAGIDATDGAFAAVLDDPDSESTTRLTAKQAQNIAEPGPVRDVLNATIGAAVNGARTNALRVGVPIPEAFGWHADYRTFVPHLTIFPDGTRRGDIAATLGGEPKKSDWLYGLYSTAITNPTHSYFASPTGNDANNGLTEGAAFRKLRSLRDFATGATNRVRATAAAGEYSGDNGFTGTGQGGSAQSPTRDTAYLAKGGVVQAGPFLTSTEMAGFQGDSRYPYTDYISAPSFSVNRVVDLMTGQDLLKVNSPTLASRQPGSWCHDVQRVITGSATTSGSPTLTSPADSYTRADQGRVITGSGIPAGTTILAVVSATEITLSANATATATGVSVTVGTGRLYVLRRDYSTPNARTTRIITDRNNFLLVNGVNVYLGSLDGSAWELVGCRSTNTGAGDAGAIKLLTSTPSATRKVFVADRVKMSYCGADGAIANAMSVDQWNGLVALFEPTGIAPAKDALNITNDSVNQADTTCILTVNGYFDGVGFGDEVSQNAVTGHGGRYWWIDIAGTYWNGHGGTFRSDAQTQAVPGNYWLLGSTFGRDQGDQQMTGGSTPPTAFRLAGGQRAILDAVKIEQQGETAVYIEANAKAYIRRNCDIVGAVTGTGTIVYFDEYSELPSVL